MRLAGIIGLLLSVGGCSGTMPTAPESASREYYAPDRLASSYYLQFPESETLNIKGQLAPLSDHETAAAVMYPGYNVGGFLAAIAVHAAVNSSIENAQEQSRVDEANQILENYEGLISAVSNDDLYEYALSGNAGIDIYATPRYRSDLEENGWLVQSEPVYTLSSSQDAVYIENRVTIQDYFLLEEDSQDAAVYDKHIAIVSSSYGDLYDESLWFADNGEYFKGSLKKLYAESIWLAVNDFRGTLPAIDSQASTIRYLENGEKKVERGKLISESCEQMLFETLRGELKVVQRAEALESAPCASELFDL